MADEARLRFYEDLAIWWPLISPASDYTEEAAYLGRMLETGSAPVREVLELGSGGGHNAVHLKSRFEMTLTDLSDRMLDVSRRLNPECEHVQGDMRTLRLDRQFDAVFAHDAIEYMTTEAQLRQAIDTAFVHCRPGGTVVLMPDAITETLEEGCDHGGSDAADGSGARYLEWTRDSDPTDSLISTDYAFLLRSVDGLVEVVHETHLMGLFAREVWLRLMTEAGFEAEVVLEETTEDRPPREIFLGRRRATAADETGCAESGRVT